MSKRTFLILCVLVFGSIFFPNYLQAQEKIAKEELFEAKVIQIFETSKIIEENGNIHPYQRLKLLGTSGSFKDKNLEIESGARDQPGVQTYKVGDLVVVNKSLDYQGNIQLRITDFVRRAPIYLLAGLFLLLAILIGGKRGASSILGMVMTFVVIFTFVLPQIANGMNPIFVTGISVAILIPITFVLSHGWNLKTICAILGTYVALLIACTLALIFIDAAHLTGFVAEEAGFLDTLHKGSIDMRGLLFAGIVIALLGVLDDITVSQAAIVMHLKKANLTLSPMELFKRAMDIGRDHIASMTSTLILVYAGASFPLLLLFTNNPLPFSSVINSEIIAEEIVRTLIASIGLILAVPITTAIAVLFVFFRNKRL